MPSESFGVPCPCHGDEMTTSCFREPAVAEFCMGGFCWRFSWEGRRSEGETRTCRKIVYLVVMGGVRIVAGPIHVVFGGTMYGEFSPRFATRGYLV